MLYGFPNTLVTFQEYINKIMAEKFDTFIIVYLDDILIYVKDTSQQYVEAMR